MTAYSITDRTEHGNVSIITITQAVSNRVWTLVSQADGHDTLIIPDGSHVDLSMRGVDQSKHSPVIEWIVNNVCP